MKTILELYLGAQDVIRDFHTLMEVLDPSVGEFEKDSAKIQRRIFAFLGATASHENEEIAETREQFIQYKGLLVARLNDSRLLRKKVKPPPTPPPTEPIRSTRASTLRLELPDFSGNPLDWHHFFKLFTSALERVGSDFSDRERSCFLLKAMKSTEADHIVRSYAAAEDGYQQALKALIMRFGAAKVFLHLVHKMTTKETITFSQEGFAKFRDQYVIPLQPMQELGCTSVSQFAACLALENLDQSLRDEWTKTYKSIDEVPSLEDLAMFLEPLEQNIQSLSLNDQPSVTHTTSRKSFSAGPRLSSSTCSICREQHRLFKCAVFAG